MRPLAVHTHFHIRRYRIGRFVGDRLVWQEVPAHDVYLSVPWIHPRLRRRVHRRGRR